MSSRQLVVCRACGGRSSSKWEFCPRCGESLSGALPGASGASPSRSGEARPASAAFANTLAILSIAAFVVICWHAMAGFGPAPRSGEGMFTLGPPPVVLPAAPPPSGAGAGDYEAGSRLLGTDLAAALRHLAAAVAADPENAVYRGVYAQALWRAGDRQRSLQEQQEAVRLDPRLRMQYARSLDVDGRSAEAAREYEQVLATDPDAAGVREDLGRLLFRSGDYSGAAAHLQAAVQNRPGDPVLRQELAYSLDQAGDKTAAAEAYRRVLQEAPAAAVARGLLSENLFAQGQKDEALAVLEQGLRASPEAPLLQRQLGSVLERSGRPAEAANAYRQYARLAPNAPDAEALTVRAERLESSGSRQ
jgi:Flp pilus assembly protein TadD